MWSSASLVFINLQASSNLLTPFPASNLLKKRNRTLPGGLFTSEGWNNLVSVPNGSKKSYFLWITASFRHFPLVKWNPSIFRYFRTRKILRKLLSPLRFGLRVRVEQ